MGDCGSIGGDCLVQTSLHAQDGAEVVMGAGMAGTEGDRRPVLGGGGVKITPPWRTRAKL